MGLGERRASWGEREPIPDPVNGALAGWVFAIVAVVWTPLFAVVVPQAVLVSDLLGLTEHHEATIVEVADPDYEENFTTWTFTLEWDGGSGELPASLEGPNSDLLTEHVWVGDTLAIVTTGPDWGIDWLGPDLDRPPLTGAWSELVWLVVGLAGTWWLWVKTWHVFRLCRGRGRGVPMPGRITNAWRPPGTIGRTRVAMVDLDAGPRASGGVHRWYGEPTSLKVVPLTTGGHVTLWGARRGWFTGRPKSPWVLRPHDGELRLVAVGWIWHRRGEERRRDQRARDGADL